MNMNKPCTPENINLMTIEDIANICDDEQLCYEIYNRIGDKSPNNSVVIFEEQNYSEIIVSLIISTDAIIRNGGFEYLYEGFYCDDPDYSMTAISYKLIKMDTVTDIFNEIRKYKIPWDEGRVEAFKNIPKDTRDEWARRYYKKSHEIVIKKLAIFVRKNIKDFVDLKPKK